MKTLLLNPPLLDLTTYGKNPVYQYSAPLGIAYLAAVLGKQGYPVEAIDLYYKDWDEIKHIVLQTKPQVVGITCLTEQRENARRLAALVKDISPEIKVIMGGTHASLMYEQILQHWDVDVVVIGEGEKTILELLEAYQTKQALSTVKGIAYKEGSRISKSPVQEIIKDMDSIPFPAYHLFDLDGYDRYGPAGKDTPFISIMTSRGCIGRCIFCSVSRVWGKQYRWRSAKNVVDEIELLVKNYQREWINFVDDIFTVNQKRVIELCKEILVRGLKIQWDCETRVDCVAPEMLEWMKKAGCQLISYGVESASPEVLSAINKKTTPQEIETAFKITRAVGIKTNLLLMAGNPEESEASINQTGTLLEG